MAEDLDKPLLDPDTFNRKGIDLVNVPFNCILLLVLEFLVAKKGFDPS